MYVTCIYNVSFWIKMCKIPNTSKERWCKIINDYLYSGLSSSKDNI